MGNRIMIWRSNFSSGQRLEPVALSPEPVSLDEATRQLPSGSYTTFRTFGLKRVLRLSSHFERLEESARLSGQLLDLDREKIRQDIRGVIGCNPSGEVRIRIILDLEKQPGTIFYLSEGLRVPSQQDYERGVRVVTREMHRTNPEAKLTAFVERADAVRQQLPVGTNEAIMVSSDGKLLEGLSSNFFAVRGSAVWTAGEGVLPGITRSLVIETIRELSIPLKMNAIHIQDLPELEEAFITSASRAVLPVTEIDGQPVGSGLPGQITKRIMDAYWKKIEAELEEI